MPGRSLALSVFVVWLTAVTPVRAQTIDDAALTELSADVQRAGIPEPVTFEKRLAAGRSLMRKGRYLEAAEEFYEAARLSPAHPLPNVLFAHAMLGNRSWREAKDVLRKALGMYPRWRRLQYPMAQDFPTSGDWDAIVEALEHQRSREPEGSGARLEYAFLLGYCYLGSGARTKARLAFEEAAKGPAAIAEARDYAEDLRPPAPTPAPRPDAPPAPAPAAPAPAGPAPAAPAGDPASPYTETDPFRRGNALVLAGRYPEAADAFLEAVIDSPGGMSGILAHFELSHALFAEGRWSQALTALRRGLRRYPEWGRVQLNRRDWYPPDRPGDFEQHLRALERAVAADPADVRLQFLLGYTAYFIGRRPQARRAFEAVVAAGPDVEAERFLELIAEAERLIPDGPPSDGPPTDAPAPEAGTPATPPTPAADPAVEAAARFAAQDFEAAWALYRRALADRADDGHLRLAASRGAFAVGDWAAAALYLRRGLQAFPIADWPGITGRWRAAFPAGGVYDARSAELAARLEQLEHATDLDGRFLLAFAYLAGAHIDQALRHFRVLKHMDPEHTDAEARFFIDRLKVE